MDLVPLKKSNLTRAQFEQLSDVPPEDECIGDLGHIRCESSGQELVWSGRNRRERRRLALSNWSQKVYPSIHGSLSAALKASKLSGFFGM
jgi:hypothetical protein